MGIGTPTPLLLNRFAPPKIKNQFDLYGNLRIYPNSPKESQLQSIRSKRLYVVEYRQSYGRFYRLLFACPVVPPRSSILSPVLVSRLGPRVRPIDCYRLCKVPPPSPPRPPPPPNEGPAALVNLSNCSLSFSFAAAPVFSRIPLIVC